MSWSPTRGTEAISSWLNQGVLFALVLAVATVIGCAVLWAGGSLAANGQAASRGRTGIAISLAAALLLGAGFTYLQWTATTPAIAFAGDPAQYTVDDTTKTPGTWEFVDLSTRWTGDINVFRARQGLPPYATDGGLTDRARSCANSRAGRSGECPQPVNNCREKSGMTFGAWDYGPADVAKLDGHLTDEQIRHPNPWGGISKPATLDASADMRSAWVALRSNANKKAVVVALLENGAGLVAWNSCLQMM